MGGIGKTTLSKAVYNNVHDQFEASCFVSDIRATANESVKGLEKLQRQILNELVKVDREIYSVAQGITQMKTHLASKRVLVILDDVDDQNQLDALAGDCYGPGSRIIITTRDKKVLQLGKIDKIHPVKGLSQDKAVQLFSWHAFLRARPENEYEDMTLKIVKSCQGLPLSLEILGAHLYDVREMRIWSEALRLNHRKVYQSLKISYDALSQEEQQMFLDIACFFVTDFFRNGLFRKTLTFYLDFWEALGCKTVYTILRSLEEKSLIRIEYNKHYSSFWMHDHVRDLGRQIVEAESPHDPSKRSRLLCEKDILSVLQHKEEMPNARGLVLPSLGPQQRNNLLDNLASMHNLKFLFSRNLKVDREIIMLPRDLRFLVLFKWENFGNSRSGFRLQGPLHFLCYLEIWNSTFVGLPSGLGSLKKLDISYCPLREFPRRFENLINLKKLDLVGCYELDELPPLPKRLVSLSVQYCHKLKKFLNMSHMTNLESLQLIACHKVKELPPLPKSLVHIRVKDCFKVQKLRELNRMQSLRELTLDTCNGLKELPPLPESLIHIKLNDCPKVEKLSSRSHMIKLENLHVSHCQCLAQLPELNCLRSLRELTLSICPSLKELPPLPEGLLKLKLLLCENLKELPPLPKGLRILKLYSCENLKELPPLPKGLINLSTQGCDQLGINASQPSTRDKRKHITSEPNNETDASAMQCFPKHSRTMELGESSVPPPAVPE